jgi:hypothetical protein
MLLFSFWTCLKIFYTIPPKENNLQWVSWLEMVNTYIFIYLFPRVCRRSPNSVYLKCSGARELCMRTGAMVARFRRWPSVTTVIRKESGETVGKSVKQFEDQYTCHPEINIIHTYSR